MAILQTTGVTGSLSISSSRIPVSTSASLFSVNGYNGRLLNVVDTLSGSLFSVNTVAGLPVFEVFSNNRVVAGKYNANDFVISGSRVGIGTNRPQAELHVSGSYPVGIIDGLTIGRGPGNIVKNTVVGNVAFNSNTAGTGNSAFGYKALRNNTVANQNSAFGALTLVNNTTGARNSAFGYKTLYNNTTNNNNAFGYYALKNNTTGTRNISIGGESLASNTIGSDNLAAGHKALYTNTTGASNVAFGSYALQANTTGYNNVAIGYNALFTNTFGAYNTAIGKDAMYSTTTGERNLAVGYRALYLNTSGIYNVAIGVGALRGNLNGRYNLGVGFRCIYVNTSGSYNNAFGNYSMYSNTTGNRNTAIGQDTLYRNTTGNNNVAIGNQAAFGTTGNNNVMLGSNAGYNSSGSNNIILGYNIDNAVLGKSNQLNIANLIFGSGSAFGQGRQISTGSNVGIGVNSPNAKLHISSSTTTSFRIETKTSSGSDTEIEFIGPDTHSYALGIDNSDSNKFKISYAASRTPPTLGTNDRFVIQTNGNVGIGTTVAEDLLSIGNINIGANYGSGYQAIWLNGGVATTDFNFLSSPTDTNLYINCPSGKGIYTQIANSNTYILTAAQARFNVPIGIAMDPTYTLDVTGTLRTSGDVGLGGAPDTGARLYVQGEALTEPFLSVQTCLGNNSTSTATYNALKGYLAIKIGNNVGTAGNLITAGTYYLRLWGA